MLLIHSQKESLNEWDDSLFIVLQSKVLVQWVTIQSLSKYLRFNAGNFPLRFKIHTLTGMWILIFFWEANFVSGNLKIILSLASQGEHSYRYMLSVLIQWVKIQSLNKGFTVQHCDQGLSSFIQWFSIS